MIDTTKIFTYDDYKKIIEQSQYQHFYNPLIPLLGQFTLADTLLTLKNKYVAAIDNQDVNINVIVDEVKRIFKDENEDVKKSFFIHYLSEFIKDLFFDEPSPLCHQYGKLFDVETFLNDDGSFPFVHEKRLDWLISKSCIKDVYRDYFDKINHLLSDAFLNDNYCEMGDFKNFDLSEKLYFLIDCNFEEIKGLELYENKDSVEMILAIWNRHFFINKLLRRRYNEFHKTRNKQ